MDVLRRAALALLAFGPLLLGSLASPARAIEAVEEYSLKAVFLLNFTKFVEWPAEAFADPADPLRVCILGHDPFGETADVVFAGEAAGGRRLELRRVATPLDAAACQVVFLSAAEEAETLARLPDAKRPYQLTVGETDEFLERGGLLRFRLQEDRLRLVVNGAALDRSRLRVSSKLLRLAEVRGRRRR